MSEKKLKYGWARNSEGAPFFYSKDNGWFTVHGKYVSETDHSNARVWQQHTLVVPVELIL